jgi:hypothetical protein
MFSVACEKAANFTRPVVRSTMNLDGAVQTGVATFILLNEEGWAATAAHVLTDVPKFQVQQAELDAINASGMDDNQRRNAIRKLKVDKSLIVKWSFWWGQDLVTADNMLVAPAADLAVMKLNGFDLSAVKHFPSFKKPSGIAAGASLIKVGFPLHQIQSSYDGKNFNFDQRGMTLFPIEGIHTRAWIAEPEGEPDPDYIPVGFVETSSPGLMGQSGGPTLDKDGVVWAIQSQTRHYSLGFRPVAQNGDGKAVEEHQFLNVGMGVHPLTIEALFKKAGIVVPWVD